MRAKLEAQHRRIPRVVVIKVLELSDGGMSVVEIASITGWPLPLINLILRGAAP